MAASIVFTAFCALVFYCFGASMMDSFVIYPAWAMMEEGQFVIVHRWQSRYIILLLVLPLAIETILNVVLLLRIPTHVPAIVIRASMGLIIVNWLLSFTIQIPIHRRLNRSFDKNLLQTLIRSNLLRVVLQIIRTGAVGYCLWAQFVY
jgi:hypothetical protein